VAVSGSRVYALGLDWNETENKWERPTAIQISGYQKSWAYPTTTDETSVQTDGAELDGYAQTGSEGRGIIAVGEQRYVFLNNEFFSLLGDNPIDGWRFVREAGIGLVSARTLVSCRGLLVWHAGDHFYRYANGIVDCISKHTIDSTLIDWTKPHNAVFNDDRYILFCTQDGLQVAMIYDLTTGAWCVRTLRPQNIVGICCASAAGDVYGLTADGVALSLFASDSDYGVTTSREVWTHHLLVAPPEMEVHISHLVLHAMTEEPNGVSLSLQFETHGAVVTSATRTLTVVPSRTQYFVGLDLDCEALDVRITCVAPKAPDIYHIGFLPGQVPSK
jgi:hypothetical protein